MTTSNVTDPVKPTVATVPFWIFLGALVVLAVGPILCPVACDHFLSPVDAPNSKQFYMHMLNTLATWVAATAGGVTLGGSLAPRLAKLYAQLSPSIPTPVTETKTP